MLLVVVAALIIGLLIGALMRRLISIRDAMRAISSGDDDLTQRLPVTGHDEVSQIASAFNAFTDKLATVMTQLRDASASVQVEANEIASGNADLRAHRTGGQQPARDGERHGRHQSFGDRLYPVGDAGQSAGGLGVRGRSARRRGGLQRDRHHGDDRTGLR